MLFEISIDLDDPKLNWIVEEFMFELPDELTLLNIFRKMQRLNPGPYTIKWDNAWLGKNLIFTFESHDDYLMWVLRA